MSLTNCWNEFAENCWLLGKEITNVIKIVRLSNFCILFPQGSVKSPAPRSSSLLWPTCYWACCLSSSNRPSILLWNKRWPPNKLWRVPDKDWLAQAGMSTQLVRLTASAHQLDASWPGYCRSYRPGNEFVMQISKPRDRDYSSFSLAPAGPDRRDWYPDKCLIPSRAVSDHWDWHPW